MVKIPFENLIVCMHNKFGKRLKLAYGIEFHADERAKNGG